MSWCMVDSPVKADVRRMSPNYQSVHQIRPYGPQRGGPQGSNPHRLSGFEPFPRRVLNPSFPPSFGGFPRAVRIRDVAIQPNAQSGLKGCQSPAGCQLLSNLSRDRHHEVSGSDQVPRSIRHRAASGARRRRRPTRSRARGRAARSSRRPLPRRRRGARPRRRARSRRCSRRSSRRPP